MTGKLDPARGARLRHERELRGWSQADVADRLGAPSPFHVSRWERGVVKPSPMYRQRYCRLFEKSAVELGFVVPAAGEQPAPVYACPECGAQMALTAA